MYVTNDTYFSIFANVSINPETTLNCPKRNFKQKYPGDTPNISFTK